MNRLAIALTATLACTVSLAPSHPAGAEPNPWVSIELNDKRPIDKGCRLAFIFVNGLPEAIEDLALEIVLFDKQQKFMRLVVIAAGQLPSGKTRLKQFDMAGTACDAIGRVLLNDVKRCNGTGLSPATCLERAKATSRVDVPFGS